MNFLPNLLELNKITARTAFLILIIAGCLLFSPSSILMKLEIISFKKEYGKYLGVAFVASAAFLILALITWCQEKIRFFFKKRKETGRLIGAIGELDFSEITVLREFYLKEQQSLMMPVDDPVVAGMLNKELLYQISRVGQQSREGVMFPIAINSLLKNYLSSETLGMPTNPTQEQIDTILSNRPDWAKSIDQKKFNSWY